MGSIWEEQQHIEDQTMEWAPSLHGKKKKTYNG